MVSTTANPAFIFFVACKFDQRAMNIPLFNHFAPHLQACRPPLRHPPAPHVAMSAKVYQIYRASTLGETLGESLNELQRKYPALNEEIKACSYGFMFLVLPFLALGRSYGLNQASSHWQCLWGGWGSGTWAWVQFNAKKFGRKQLFV